MQRPHSCPSLPPITTTSPLGPGSLPQGPGACPPPGVHTGRMGLCPGEPGLHNACDGAPPPARLWSVGPPGATLPGTQAGRPLPALQRPRRGRAGTSAVYTDSRPTRGHSTAVSGCVQGRALGCTPPTLEAPSSKRSVKFRPQSTVRSRQRPDAKTGTGSQSFPLTHSRIKLSASIKPHSLSSPVLEKADASTRAGSHLRTPTPRPEGPAAGSRVCACTLSEK